MLKDWETIPEAVVTVGIQEEKRRPKESTR